MRYALVSMIFCCYRKLDVKNAQPILSERLSHTASELMGSQSVRRQPIASPRCGYDAGNRNPTGQRPFEDCPASLPGLTVAAFLSFL